jgi:anaerobic selenocysteine-containing dehydrogenase
VLPPAEGDEFPLSLISPATSKAISSTLYELVRETVPVKLHPADALARRIAEGDEVRVFNQSGEVRTTARVESLRCA